MKSVRIFFTKSGNMKFVSHLDMNRFMSRALKRAEIPIWYTEGYNPHPYINFALPLSLGFNGRYEIMDIKTEEEIDFDEIFRRLSAVCPDGIKILSVSEPIEKNSHIGFARFEIVFDTQSSTFFEHLQTFLNRDSIICTKTTKKGGSKEIDLAPKIRQKNISGNTLMLLLPAGPKENINPTLLLDSFFEQTDSEYVCYSVTRTEILDDGFKPFR